MNNKIIEYLQQQGYSPCKDYYDKIELWINLWKGKTKFHEYYVVYDKQKIKQEMYSLGMPQRIAQDWSSICWAEKDTITTTVKNQKYLDKSLASLKFNKILPLAIEKSAYSGTCGAILRVKNAKLIENGEEKYLGTDKFTQYDLITVTGDQIIPLRVEHGKIIDCAFISENNIQDKKIYYIEIHELVKKKNEDEEEYETYKIRNIFIDNDGNEVEKEGVLKEYYTNSNIPLFSILVPPTDNPYENSNGLGVAIYGNAVDQLYGVDIAYHNFVMDYYLGGKKMFYNKKLCQQDENGNVIYPTNVQKQQWQVVGDEMENANEKSLIHEYNPDLRITENTEGLQFFLDLLSFKCGLGTKYYQFNQGTVVTATQYLGEKQDLVINARKYRENVDEFIENICRGILLLGKRIFKADVDENAEVNIVNEDGFLVSTEELKQQYIEEMNAGLRSKISYLKKFRGMTEEEARQELALINDEENVVVDIGE